jgi:hypothetical protein
MTSPTLKRALTVMDPNPTENACKKPRTSAPVAGNRAEYHHAYKPYDNHSIPLLVSVQIRHQESPLLFNNPSVHLKIKALARLEQAGCFSAEELGRPEATKKGPTKIIDDVDLYLTSHGKIYVATEHGLLLASHYLQLAGIPNHTPVSFRGTRPAWVKASLAQRTIRRIEIAGEEDPYASDREESEDGEDSIWRYVQVYLRHPTNGRAYGRRLDNNRLGWFEWDRTTALDAPHPEWDGVFTPDLMAATARAHAP